MKQIITRYQESTKQSGEFLRLVIPFIAKHQLAATPTSYTVSYEYIAGLNKQLVEAIDERLGNGDELDDEFVDELYDAYVANPDVIRSKEVIENIKILVRNLSESTANADEGFTEFDRSLRHSNEALDGVAGSSAVHQIITELLTATQSMERSFAPMCAEIEKSQREIANLQAKLNEAQAETLTDPMTGLANRTGFSIAMNEAIAKATKTKVPFVLVMVDIDHFKRVNDNHGHLVGDKVIQFLSATLKKHLKGQDTAARLGGEEFAILLPETPLSGGHSVAEKIRVVMELARLRRANSNEAIGQITVSLGLARYQEGESIDDLIARADAALYRSKNEGRNRTTVDDGNDALSNRSKEKLST